LKSIQENSIKTHWMTFFPKNDSGDSKLSGIEPEKFVNQIKKKKEGL